MRKTWEMPVSQFNAIGPRHFTEVGVILREGRRLGIEGFDIHSAVDIVPHRLRETSSQEGRNGFHRAYALSRAVVTHAPYIFRDVTDSPYRYSPGSLRSAFVGIKQSADTRTFHRGTRPSRSIEIQ